MTAFGIPRPGMGARSHSIFSSVLTLCYIDQAGPKLIEILLPQLSQC